MSLLGVLVPHHPDQRHRAVTADQASAPVPQDSAHQDQPGPHCGAHPRLGRRLGAGWETSHHNSPAHTGQDYGG